MSVALDGPLRGSRSDDRSTAIRPPASHRAGSSGRAGPDRSGSARRRPDRRARPLAALGGRTTPVARRSSRRRPRRPRLGPALSRAALGRALPRARPGRRGSRSRPGLLQVHDFWDASHEAAQEADDLGERAVLGLLARDRPPPRARPRQRLLLVPPGRPPPRLRTARRGRRPLAERGTLPPGSCREGSGTRTPSSSSVGPARGIDAALCAQSSADRDDLCCWKVAPVMTSA